MNSIGKIRKKSGITLISLVVTIIVLLILAGVTIATLTGDNGILTRAQDAKNKTEQAQKDEEDILNSYEDQINEYAGIDWDKVLANAKKHPEQTTSTAIGVGTDGRPVNMDLWEYTKLDDGTYALNDLESVAPTGTRTSGYTGNTIDGKIEGTIPQYIKDKTDGSFIEVTSIPWLFYQNTELTTSPKLPDTITNMYNTFNSCNNLITVGNIPDRVTNMQGTFNACTNLTTVENIPNSVENMSWTFTNCTSLQQIPNISNNVTNMQGTFKACTNLTTVENIPNSVENMSWTFQNCTNLITVGNIPDSVTDMESTFHNCTSLQQIPDIPNKVTNMYSTFRNCNSLTKINITIPKTVTNIRNMFSGCTHLCGNINILANLSLAIEEDGYYSYNGWLDNTSTETTENLILGPIENKTLIEQIIPNNSNIKGVWE